MPTTLLYRETMNDGKGIVDESRAYQLARELSMLGINGHCSIQGHSTSDLERSLAMGHADFDDRIHNGNLNVDSNDCLPQDMNINFTGGFSESNGGMFANPTAANALAGNRKSANMTETVPVPSSEHVAEIVGRQGCKIKALRAKTNTYIKTPVRGEEPVFVVTGRKEDVARAKHEILSAAEHFSQIRASRRTAACTPATASGNCSPVCVPGHITIQVRVPYKVVGLVVGPKGATIKRIQQATSTYIVTPGRDKEPVFEVTGLPDSVEKAREEIEKHIASRTGTDNNSDLQIDDFNINGIDSGFHDQTGSDSTVTSGSEGYGGGSGGFSAKNGSSSESHMSVMGGHQSAVLPYHQHALVANGNGSVGCSGGGKCSTSLVRSCTCCGPSSLIQSHSHSHRPATEDFHPPFAVPDYVKQYNSPFTNFNPMMMGSGDQFDVDEGIGASGGSIFDPTAAAIWSSSDVSAFGIQRSNSIGVSSARILPPGDDGPHPRTRRTNSDPLATALQAAFSSSSRSSSQASTSPVTGRRNNERGSHTTTSTVMSSPALASAVSRRSAQCLGCVGPAAGNGHAQCNHSSYCVKCTCDSVSLQRPANCSNGTNNI